MSLRTNSTLTTLTVFYMAIFLWNCAVQRSPTGGPVDKTPPRVLEVVPAKNATHIPLDQKIEFTFSESMDRKSSEKAVFITPNPDDRVKIDWKGRRLRVEFRDSLRVSRTYVITLGTDLRDEHGIALAQSYTLAFSTGEELSDGKISGRVYSDQKKQGVLIWAYILDGIEDPDPRVRAGDYVTQTDGEGRFQLSNLSEGRYRVFAILDSDNNRFFEVGVDALGIPSRDIELDHAGLSASDLNFRLALKDTLGPALLTVSVQDRRHLRLGFDEALQTEGTEETSHYRIVAMKTKTELGVDRAYSNYLDRKEIVLVTSPQAAPTRYELEVQNLTDQFGNSVDPNFNSIEFVGSAIPDTAGPKLVTSAPEDSAKGVLPESKITFHFSKPIQQDAFQRNFQLLDSLDNQLTGLFEWQTPADGAFAPEQPLLSLAWYRIHVRPDSVLDLVGNRMSGTSPTIRFKTANADTFSSILGSIVDEDSTAQGRIFIIAKPKEKEGQTYQISVERPGPYRFDRILPGAYRLEGFRDRDGNGEYTFGTAVPFQPSERLFVDEQDIKVRSRWPNEGNDLKIHK